ncbi:MAG: hypothetical protein ACOYL3_13045 [Desulfuromonadaceae bacterium]
MKHTNKINSCLILGAGAAVLASALLWSTPLIASDYSFSGESNTIFRMRTTVNDKTLSPAYEYLRLNMTDESKDGSAVSFYLGAWGRADLGSNPNDNSTNGNLQYAYLTYQAAKNNTVFTIGRQFISEGVAAERFDGVYLRNDFGYGVGVSAFVGSSVTTEQSADPKYQGGELIYGTRISRGDKKIYSIGLSALKSESATRSNYREEEGLDLWVRPHQQVDINGRSTYNSITNGWMENSYAVSYAPTSTVNLSADFSHINLNDYLFNVTTVALSSNNPIWSSNNKQTTYGTSAAYTAIKNLTVSADYKFYSYDQSGDASYFGGKASYKFPEGLLAGGGLHRMAGDTDKLCYTEFRAFVAKKISQADLTLDAINVNYDKKINGISNSYVITGAAGYEFNQKLKVRGDLQYSQNPDFDSEVRALVMATYTFDTKFVAEGGTKSEK